MKIIFLNSYSPRTGHNFVAQVIRFISGYKIFPYEHSETKLHTLLQLNHDFIAKKVYHKRDKDFMNELFFLNVKEKLKTLVNENCIIKDTSVLGCETQAKLFYDDHHIIAIRDPRDTLKSLFKGMNLRKKGFLVYGLKKIGIFTGIYSYYYSRLFSKKYLAQFPSSFKNTLVIRFEDLYFKNEVVLKEIIEYLGVQKDIEILKKEIDSINVINTSFYKEETKANSIWDAKIKSNAFNPVNRKIPFLHRKGIELGCKPLRKHLGYL